MASRRHPFPSTSFKHCFTTTMFKDLMSYRLIRFFRLILIMLQNPFHPIYLQKLLCCSLSITRFFYLRWDSLLVDKRIITSISSLTQNLSMFSLIGILIIKKQRLKGWFMKCWFKALLNRVLAHSLCPFYLLKRRMGLGDFV